MWGMTEETKSTKAASKSGQTAASKPGEKLLKWGAGVLALGVLFVVMGLSSTKVDAYGVETTVGPTPVALLVTAAGVALLVWGFCKRILAAVEKD